MSNRFQKAEFINIKCGQSARFFMAVRKRRHHRHRFDSKHPTALII